MSFPDKIDDRFHSEISFNGDKCLLTLSGKFDWTEALFEGKPILKSLRKRLIFDNPD